MPLIAYPPCRSCAQRTNFKAFCPTITMCRRKEVEDELRNTKQELEGHLKEAREEIEVCVFCDLL